jgi:peroxiredoxin
LAGYTNKALNFVNIGHKSPVNSKTRKDGNMAEHELEVGSMVPDFTLPSNQGGEVKFSDYRGKKVVLFFVREYE